MGAMIGSSYEYAISVGEGTLYAYGVAGPTTIQSMVMGALDAHGTVTVVTETATPTTETGAYTHRITRQVCS